MLYRCQFTTGDFGSIKTIYHTLEDIPDVETGIELAETYFKEQERFKGYKIYTNKVPHRNEEGKLISEVQACRETRSTICWIRPMNDPRVLGVD